MRTDAAPYSAARRNFKLIRTGGISFCFTSIFTATTARALAPATRPVGRHWWRSLSNSTGNKLFRSGLIGYQNAQRRIYPQGVTLECFTRGSTAGLAWIPDTSIRESQALRVLGYCSLRSR